MQFRVEEIQLATQQRICNISNQKQTPAMPGICNIQANLLSLIAITPLAEQTYPKLYQCQAFFHKLEIYLNGLKFLGMQSQQINIPDLATVDACRREAHGGPNMLILW
ncbi:hypothetical protein FGO68_gene2249 [Halteria grandinella]|uniref:Uncharacterized protein n=1 Tax=Halteria grandinella TaxID=5974 RepID=A0A8J8NYW7_HALGN|nr:hypothetical protein FGO68_gene2249 [Halteria grandinella]